MRLVRKGIVKVYRRKRSPIFFFVGPVSGRIESTYTDEHGYVMRLRIIRMDLPLKHVMIVGHSTISVVRAVIVELEQDGLRGYGEAYEEPEFGITVENIVRQLEGSRREIDRYALADPLAFSRQISPILKDSPTAMCAMEMAACDLCGKLRNRPLWKIWHYDISNVPRSSYSLTLDSLFRVMEKFEECPDWPIYRVMMGGNDDLEILRELRRRTNAVFRLDVGGNWTLDQTIDYLDELRHLNVELIEQPLPRDDWDAMAILKEKSSIPIFADESCRCDADIDKCARFFDGVNLKPIKFGGLYPTRNAIAKAKHLGLQTMIGSTIESSVAASAVSQFAPVLDYVYLDGPMLIDKKIGQGVQLDLGKITFSTENGTGIRFTCRS